MQPRPICDYEGVRYSTDFWGKGREYEDRVERIALRRLLPNRARRLVDIGAGFGRLADLYDGVEQVVLLDYSLSQLREARRRLGHNPRFLFVAGDVYNFPFVDGLFDVAVMVRVVHHLVDVDRAFAEIHRITGAGGVFVLEYANKRHLKALLRYLARRSPVSPFDLEPYEFAPLHFDFHPRYIEGKLREAGFEIEDALGVSFFRVPWLKRHIPLKLLVALDSLLQRPLAPLRLTPSVILKNVSRKGGSPPTAEGFFRCPRCGGARLREESSEMVCLGCGARWPVRDGIYDFRPGGGEG